MMIGNNEIDFVFSGPSGSRKGNNTVVNRDKKGEVGVFLVDTGQGLRINAITIYFAMGKKRNYLSPQRMQGFLKNGGSTNTVNVIITVNDDFILRFDGFFDERESQKFEKSVFPLQINRCTDFVYWLLILN